MHRTPPQEPGDDSDDRPEEDYESAMQEQDLGDTELDRDDTHGLADEISERAEGHS